MDERKIPDFIAMCANSNFVFEVNQLRVNRHLEVEPIAFNGGVAKNDTGGGGMMGGMPGSSGGGPGGGTSLPPLKSRDVESRINFDVSVEFFGVVKLYNPVRENFLRKAAGQEVVDETAQEIEAPEQPEAVAPANNGQPAGVAPAVAGPAAPALGAPAGQPANGAAPAALGQAPAAAQPPAAAGAPAAGAPAAGAPAAGAPAAGATGPTAPAEGIKP